MWYETNAVAFLSSRLFPAAITDSGEAIASASGRRDGLAGRHGESAPVLQPVATGLDRAALSEWIASCLPSHPRAPPVPICAPSRARTRRDPELTGEIVPTDPLRAPVDHHLRHGCNSAILA